LVYGLKREFPDLHIVLNGGVKGDEDIARHLAEVDGVMVGRHAYHEPWSMVGWDTTFLGGEAQQTGASVDETEDRWVDYLQRLHREGRPWMSAMRHAMGLRNGQPGARRWRQVWSDHRLRDLAPREVQRLSTQARSRPPVPAEAA